MLTQTRVIDGVVEFRACYETIRRDKSGAIVGADQVCGEWAESIEAAIPSLSKAARADVLTGLAMEAQAERLRTANLKDAIREAQWAGGDIPECPWCGAKRDNGKHDSACIVRTITAVTDGGAA